MTSVEQTALLRALLGTPDLMQPPHAPLPAPAWHHYPSAAADALAPANARAPAMPLARPATPRQGSAPELFEDVLFWRDQASARAREVEALQTQLDDATARATEAHRAQLLALPADADRWLKLVLLDGKRVHVPRGLVATQAPRLAEVLADLNLHPRDRSGHQPLPVGSQAWSDFVKLLWLGLAPPTYHEDLDAWMATWGLYGVLQQAYAKEVATVTWRQKNELAAEVGIRHLERRLPYLKRISYPLVRQLPFCLLFTLQGIFVFRDGQRGEPSQGPFSYWLSVADRRGGSNDLFEFSVDKGAETGSGRYWSELEPNEFSAVPQKLFADAMLSVKLVIGRPGDSAKTLKKQRLHPPQRAGDSKQDAASEKRGHVNEAKQGGGAPPDPAGHWFFRSTK